MPFTPMNLSSVLRTLRLQGAWPSLRAGQYAVSWRLVEFGWVIEYTRVTA